ncbi:FadR/GntR family transcriptional regulator [Rhodococcus koreensis]
MTVDSTLGRLSAERARRSVIRPLDEGGRAEAVALRLREAIALGVLGDGEQLPNEADLSSEIGVSTKTLREALAWLRQEGLIETRRGRTGGSFIRRAKGLTRRIAQERLDQMTAVQIRDLADMHRAVSGTAAFLAAERADQDQLNSLKALADAFAESRDSTERSRLDSRFHIEVAILAQSERLTEAEVDLQTASRDILWVLALSGRDVEKAHAEHVQIWHAIAGQVPDQARSLAEKHVIDNLRRIEQLRLHGPKLRPSSPSTARPGRGEEGARQ